MLKMKDLEHKKGSLHVALNKAFKKAWLHAQRGPVEDLALTDVQYISDT